MSYSAAAQSQAGVLGSTLRPTSVSVLAEYVLWSEFDTTSKKYHLMLYRAGIASRLPVPGRPVPFDASLGTDRRGSKTIVYSHCRREPRERIDAQPSLPAMATGRGCDLYAYRLSSRQGAESRVHLAGSTGMDEVLPTLWRGKFVVVRTPRRSGRKGVVPTLVRVQPGQQDTLPSPDGVVGRDLGGDYVRSVPFTGPGPISVRYRRGRVTYTWGVLPRGNRCAGGTDPQQRIDAVEYQARTWAHGRTRILDRTCTHGKTRFLGAAQAGETFGLLVVDALNRNEVRQLNPPMTPARIPLDGPATSIDSDGEEFVVVVREGSVYTIRSV